MKVARVSLIAVLCVIVSAPAALAASGSQGTVAPHYYVSLGDSFAEGDQLPGMSFDEGYADQLYASLRQDDPTLQLVKLGCGGESTTSMLVGSLHQAEGSSCGTPRFYRKTYPVGGTQLSQAVSFLHAHASFVSLVTIDIGGNDVGACIAQLDASCLASASATMTSNLTTIVAALREAAGPVVPIVGMNYYDPFLVYWFSDAAAASVTVQMVTAFNDDLGTVYGDASIPVADVETAFFTTVPFTTTVGEIPLSVAAICEWTWMCSNFDLHPNTTGYGVIAQAFEVVLT
jgi:lysophospholipase L1-like esterase